MRRSGSRRAGRQNCLLRKSLRENELNAFHLVEALIAWIQRPWRP